MLLLSKTVLFHDFNDLQKWKNTDPTTAPSYRHPRHNRHPAPWCGEGRSAPKDPPNGGGQSISSRVNLYFEGSDPISTSYDDIFQCVRLGSALVRCDRLCTKGKGVTKLFCFTVSTISFLRLVLISMYYL